MCADTCENVNQVPDTLDADPAPLCVHHKPCTVISPFASLPLFHALAEVFRLKPIVNMRRSENQRTH